MDDDENVGKGEDVMENDPVEKLLMMVQKDSRLLNSLSKLLDSLEKSGVINIIDKLSKNAVPSDSEYLFDFFTSEPMRNSLLKFGNLALLLMASLSDEDSLDSIKLLTSNLGYIVQSASEYADANGKTNILKLYSALRDPDISYTIASLLGALKATGGLLREFHEEKGTDE